MHWKLQLQDLLRRHNGQHIRRNKIISAKTQQERARILFLCFKQLREANFMIANVTNLRGKHIEALTERWAKEELAASTIQARLSVLRGFAVWIGKPGLVREPEHYLPKHIVQRSYVAREDKSWVGHGVDFDEVLTRLAAEDSHVAMQVRLIRAFGLRRKEAVMLKPNRADKGGYLAVGDGTKGGRDRVVPIDSNEKRAVLDAAKALAGSSMDAHMGSPGRTLQQNLDRISNLVRKHGIAKADLGVSLHGLRHEYSHSRYREKAGAEIPLKGGVTDRETERAARLEVSEELGHSRERVTSAYYGPIATPAQRRRAAEAGSPVDEDIPVSTT